MKAIEQNIEKEIAQAVMEEQPMQPLSTRTAHFTDSVIRRMTRISNQYGAVNLSQASRILTRPKQFWTVWPRSRTRTTTSTPSPGARRTSREALAAKQTAY